MDLVKINCGNPTLDRCFVFEISPFRLSNCIGVLTYLTFKSYVISAEWSLGPVPVTPTL